VLVSNAWDGEFGIEIANHYGTKATGKIHARRSSKSIKLDGVDKLKLSRVDRITSRIPSRNDDRVPYRVSWRLVNVRSCAVAARHRTDLRGCAS